MLSTKENLTKKDAVTRLHISETAAIILFSRGKILLLLPVSLPKISLYNLVKLIVLSDQFEFSSFLAKSQKVYSASSSSSSSGLCSLFRSPSFSHSLISLLSFIQNQSFLLVRTCHLQRLHLWGFDTLTPICLQTQNFPQETWHLCIYKFLPRATRAAKDFFYPKPATMRKCYFLWRVLGRHPYWYW